MWFRLIKSACVKVESNRPWCDFLGKKHSFLHARIQGECKASKPIYTLSSIIRINPLPHSDTNPFNALKSLNVSKSCGPDNCHPFFLKECAEEIYLPLTDILHKSLSSGVIPDDWKKANITCIFKQGKA